MHSLNLLTVILTLALAQKVIAQSTVLFFTSSPTTVAIGQAVTVTYTAPNLTAPATIVLRKGDPADLDTIATLTTNATEGTYTFTPSTNLIPSSDYALEILQGSDSNYGRLFSVISAAAAAAAAAASSSSASTTSLPANANATATATSSSSLSWPVPTGLGPVPGNGSVVLFSTTSCASSGGVLPGYGGGNATVVMPTLGGTSGVPGGSGGDVSSVSTSSAAGAADVTTAPVAPGTSGTSGTSSLSSSSGSVTADAVSPASTGAAGRGVHVKGAFTAALVVIGSCAFALL